MQDVLIFLSSMRCGTRDEQMKKILPQLDRTRRDLQRLHDVYVVDLMAAIQSDAMQMTHFHFSCTATMFEIG